MTIEEFKKQSFGWGDKVRYKDGVVYDIAQVDFEEQLVGLLMHISGGEPTDISWVRCESVDYFAKEKVIDEF